MSRLRKHAKALHTLTAQGAGTVNSAAIDCAEWDGLLLHINLTSVTGSLTVVPQFSPDGGTTWLSAYNEAMAAITSGALAATTARAWAISRVGTLFRAQMVIATGPVSAVLWAEFTKSGGRM